MDTVYIYSKNKLLYPLQRYLRYVKNIKSIIIDYDNYSAINNPFFIIYDLSLCKDIKEEYLRWNNLIKLFDHLKSNYPLFYFLVSDGDFYRSLNDFFCKYDFLPRGKNISDDYYNFIKINVTELLCKMSYIGQISGRITKDSKRIIYNSLRNIRYFFNNELRTILHNNCKDSGFENILFFLNKDFKSSSRVIRNIENIFLNDILRLCFLLKDNKILSKKLSEIQDLLISLKNIDLTDQSYISIVSIIIKKFRKIIPIINKEYLLNEDN